MKPVITISVVLLLLRAAAVAAPDENKGASGQHKAVLSGYEVVPAVYSAGSGVAVARIAESGSELSVTLSYSGLKGVAKAANLHVGQLGVNGAVVAALCGSEGKAACPAQATDLLVNLKPADVKAVQGIEAGALDTLIDALEHGVVYVSITTDKSADGELRGQFRRGNGQGTNEHGGDKEKDDDSKDKETDEKDKEKDKKDKGQGV